MDEVESLGGPLICVERRFADQWLGIDGISIREGELPAGAQTDYDRACFIPNRSLSVIPLAHGSALILGDMPLTTGVWKDRLGQTIIWRIFFEDPDDDVLSRLASLPEGAYSESLQSVEFSFESKNIVIFDSSCPGKEAEPESVSFEIVPGKYLVTTHIVRPVPSMELVLHRFYPVA